MSEVITTPPVVTTPTTARIVGRWMVSFLGFPLGGFAALLLTEPVNSASHAVLGGLITGVVLGAVQSWGLRFGRHDSLSVYTHPEAQDFCPANPNKLRCYLLYKNP